MNDITDYVKEVKVIFIIGLSLPLISFALSLILR